MTRIHGNTFDRARELIRRVHALAAEEGLVFAGAYPILEEGDEPWWFDLEFTFADRRPWRVANLLIRDDNIPVEDLARLIVKDVKLGGE